MRRIGGHQLHLWLIAAGVVLAILLGSSLGWALALASVACGAMLVIVFLIGRSSAKQLPSPQQARDSSDANNSADRWTSI